MLFHQSHKYEKMGNDVDKVECCKKIILFLVTVPNGCKKIILFLVTVPNGCKKIILFLVTIPNGCKKMDKMGHFWS